jgi:hypothetical protein
MPNSTLSPRNQIRPAARCLSIAIVWISLLTVATTPTWAKTRYVDFKDLMAQSETIAIVGPLQMLPESFLKTPRVTLNVLKVLKGNMKVGKREVGLGPYPGPGEFVAFFDKFGVWKFTAAPLSKRKADADVLAISCSDESGVDFVTPELVTLAQLEAYLKNGSLRYVFRGDVWFPQRGQVAWKPSPLRIHGTYDAIRKSANVTGLGKLEGLPAQPEVFVDSDGGGTDRWRLHLRYSSGSDRPLEIIGKVEGLDPKSGEIVARFAVTDPDVLSQTSLQDYLADPRRGHYYYTYRLHCTPAKDQFHGGDLLLTLNRDSVGYLEGWGKTRSPIAQTSYSGPSGWTGTVGTGHLTFPDDWVLRMVARTQTIEYLILAVDAQKPIGGKDIFRWTFGTPLLYRVYSGPTGGSLQVYEGTKLRTLGTFTVSIDAVGFDRLEMPP